MFLNPEMAIQTPDASTVVFMKPLNTNIKFSVISEISWVWGV